MGRPTSPARKPARGCGHGTSRIAVSGLVVAIPELLCLRLCLLLVLLLCLCLRLVRLLLRRLVLPVLLLFLLVPAAARCRSLPRHRLSRREQRGRSAQ